MRAMAVIEKKIQIAFLGSIYILLLTVPEHCNGQYQRTTTIRSPYVTNWGDWGPWSMCNSGKYVVGFQLKTERSQGGGDNTALNGIELQCATIGSSSDDSLLYSKTGEWGSWGRYYRCTSGSVMTGFQLRSEPHIGKGDDTAANNLIGFCSSATTNQRTDFMEGDGMSWGDYSASQHCPTRYGICGMSTQVEPKQEGGDDTSLNNVAMLCCPLPILTTTTPRPPTCTEKSTKKCGQYRNRCTECYEVCLAAAANFCRNRQ